MGQDARTHGTAALTLAEGDPERIREQIETTRAELGDTVAALAVKADVKRQVSAHRRPLIGVGGALAALVVLKLVTKR